MFKRLVDDLAKGRTCIIIRVDKCSITESKLLEGKEDIGSTF